MLIKNVFQVLESVKPFEQAWAEEAQKALQSQLPLWVVLGDSMSLGIGASEFRKGWVGQALDMLHRQGKDHAVINLSKSGARIDDVLHSQLPALEALHIKPVIITILVGSNDLLSPKYRPKLQVNLKKLLTHLPEGTIIGNIFDRPSIPMPLRSIFGHRSASDLLLKIADQRKLIVVSLDEAFKTPWRGKLASDRYHPNDHGYKDIALAFMNVMQKIDHTKQI
jgi:lysophospholipase L1-like esterase